MRLRPPGALPEREFLARCIQCQRCVAVCVYRAIRPADWRYGLAVRTPVIEPRQAACTLCMDCPPVCPSGALEVVSKEEVKMGVAQVDEATCYAFLGVLCRSCIEACPFQGTAIRQDASLQPIVDEKTCVGCGLCVEVCPAEPEAIRVRNDR